MIERIFARVICGKAAVIGRMPVLRSNNKREQALDLVHNGNHPVPVRHRQRPTGNEVILNIYKDERFHKIMELGNR